MNENRTSTWLGSVWGKVLGLAAVAAILTAGALSAPSCATTGGSSGYDSGRDSGADESKRNGSGKREGSGSRY